MRATVTDRSGKQWTLPPATGWRLDYTAGVPCDSFVYRCVWDQGNQTRPADWVGFTAEYEGARVFTGLVDECEVSLSQQGRHLELSGRGMAALLLDNEALGQDYGTATLEDMLRDHVRPYGINVAPGANLPAVSQFSVATGSSEWSVVYNFARYHGGIMPRFNQMGQLVLTPWQTTKEHVLGDGAPVKEITLQNRRYGVLSQVLVRDRYSGRVETVSDPAAVAAGIRARRVITQPGRSNYKAMRYSGQFQLDQAARGCVEQTVVLAQPFCIWPGELVRLNRTGWEGNGLYRASQVSVGLDAGGKWSRLSLVLPHQMA